MNSTKSPLAAASDRVRLTRLTRGELEHLLRGAKRAFEAFGASAGRQDDGHADASPGCAGAPTWST